MSYGIFTLLPSLISIILALITKQVIISLFAGIYIGELILSGGALLPSLNASLERIISVFSEGWTTKTIIFCIFVGSIITLIQISGGVEGFVDYLTTKTQTIKSRKASMMLGYIVGIVIFIESTITCLVSGAIARPVTDKYNVSREKLAYIVDSTSAPMCSIIPFNSWGATLLGLISAQITAGVISGNPVRILGKSLLFNFYSVITILSVAFYILTDKDFGPMKSAEIRAKTTGAVIREGSTPLISDDVTEISTKDGVKPNMWNMILPLIVLIGMIPLGLYITGNGNTLSGSGSTAVFWAVFATIVFCGILYKIKGIMNLDEFINYTFKGAGGMLQVTSILVFAFAIGNVIGDLKTGEFIASTLSGKINPSFIPALIFVFSSIIAFSTGTSFGTFAIMTPIAVSMHAGLNANLYLCIGAVISGGVMGDHCSPISDTTIISSMATACDHIDHVKTQLPYALLNGAMSFILYMIFGFIV